MCAMRYGKMKNGFLKAAVLLNFGTEHIGGRGKEVKVKMPVAFQPRHFTLLRTVILDVNCFAVSYSNRFFHRFTHSWVGVNSVQNFVAGSFQFTCY
ncbi:hypothetical protein SAMN05421788_111180 [Filimonas lacunae]|uniref:Uncharacterized protein n=1 Tax=Filimonas lacunae TaxID=477680 RepID=A0A1N7RC43_9BACT|nr:hypothetical protein SAMN05421788_111180 [Filimonas lacunae]